LRGHTKEYMRKEFSGDKNQIVGRTFHVAKWIMVKLLEINIFFFCHNILGVVKLQDLPNKKS
jgi:hypothetical protein